ncbi:MAG: hypothetical protein ABIH23_08475 [bacterium]
MTEDEIKKWADIIAETMKNEEEAPEEEVESDEALDKNAENIVVFLKKKK